MGKGDKMLKQIRTYIFSVLIIIFFLSIYPFYHTNNLYGNDKESIIKVIHSIEGYKNRSIDILGIKDYNDMRMVGFLSDNEPGCATFVKEKWGQYRWLDIEVKQGETFALFYRPISVNNKKVMIVTNSENKIAKMRVNLNGKGLEAAFTPQKPGVIWLDLPQTYDFIDTEYYDQDGKLIQTD